MEFEAFISPHHKLGYNGAGGVECRETRDLVKQQPPLRERSRRSYHMKSAVR